jgi:hypothetical protein
MKILLTFIFSLLLFTGRPYAQETGTAVDSVMASDGEDENEFSGESTTTVAADRPPYVRREISRDGLQKLKTEKGLEYEDWENKAPEEKKQEQSAGSRPFIDGKALLWFFGVLVVIVIIMQLAGFNFRQLFAGRSLQMQQAEVRTTDNIHHIAFEKEIAAAIQSGNYVAATRLLYLQSLKQLSDKRIIDWQEHKTNHQYEYEIGHAELRRRFGVITRIYELVFYGHRSIDEERFRQVHAIFTDFKSMVP